MKMSRNGHNKINTLSYFISAIITK